MADRRLGTSQQRVRDESDTAVFEAEGMRTGRRVVSPGPPTPCHEFCTSRARLSAMRWMLLAVFIHDSPSG